MIEDIQPSYIKDVVLWWDRNDVNIKIVSSLACYYGERGLQNSNENHKWLWLKHWGQEFALLLMKRVIFF